MSLCMVVDCTRSNEECLLEESLGVNDPHYDHKIRYHQKRMRLLETLADSNRSYGNHSKPLQIAIRDDQRHFNNLKTLADSNDMQLYRIEPLQITNKVNEITETLAHSIKNESRKRRIKPLQIACNTNENANKSCL